MKSITIILTIYKPLNSELKYWKSISKKLIKNGFDFFVINDNPQEDYSEYFGKSIYNNKENLGKFPSVYNFVKKISYKVNIFSFVILMI